jgi:hypothetical protein
LSPGGKPEQVHRLGKGRPHGSQGFPDPLERFLATGVVAIVGMDEMGSFLAYGLIAVRVRGPGLA